MRLCLLGRVLYVGCLCGEFHTGAHCVFLEVLVFNHVSVGICMHSDANSDAELHSDANSDAQLEF